MFCSRCNYGTDEDFYRLGTRNGKLKQLYARSQFSVCEQPLVILEVPNSELSLRAFATEQSLGTGQDFQKCSCIKHCNIHRYRCTCAKKKLCNSKCHSSLLCSNK